MVRITMIRSCLAAALAAGFMLALGSRLDAVEHVSATEGAVEKVDKATKTVLVRPKTEPSTRFILWIGLLCTERRPPTTELKPPRMIFGKVQKWWCIPPRRVRRIPRKRSITWAKAA